MFISPHTHLFSQGSYFGNDIGKWNGFTDVINKVSNLVIQYFTLLQNIGLLIYAAKQFFVDYLPSLSNKTDIIEDTLDYRLQDSVKKHFDSIQLIKSDLSLELSAFFGTSGVFGLTAALGALNIIDLGPTLPFFAACGWVQFLLGCLCSLDRNNKIYHEACLMEEESFGEEQKLAERIKLSAILGIISDLSYIAITIFSIVGGPLALHILLGCFAVSAISLQNIYNFFYL